MNMNNEPCGICEEFIEGVICDKDKCPVSIMKKENEKLKAAIYNLKEDLKEYRNVPILTKNDCLIATVEKRADGKQYHNALLTIKINEIRAEAYKEFAEEFEKRCIASGVYPAVTKNILKNLLKELTEGSNG